jgi:hypothetical protein
LRLRRLCSTHFMITMACPMSQAGTSASACDPLMGLLARWLQSSKNS